MPRRSKRKQAKKAEPAAVVEEAETPGVEETETPGQDEESHESSSMSEDHDPGSSEQSGQTQETKEGDNPDGDTEMANSDEDAQKESGDSISNKQDDLAEVGKQESDIQENMQTDDAPVAQDVETKDALDPTPKEEDEVEPMQAEDSTPQEVQMQNTDNSMEKVASTEDEEQKETPEEEDVIKIEKEPTVPYCYDNDKEPVVIDPEGDEGEVLIGNESPEFLKYWRAILDNPHDFTNWTYLLQLVEQENKPPLARRAYNGFFKRYPLCYGYWKKFSEFERRNGNFVRAQRILERGVRAIPLSIDLWVHMIDFYITHYKGPDAGREKIKKVFERAVAAAGEEFRSEKLWNKYLQWEKEGKDWKVVMALYDRMIRLPTQHYAVYFKDFKDFVMSRAPSEILEVDEFEKLLEEVRDDAEKKEQEKRRKREEKKEKEKAKEKDEKKEEAPPAASDDDPPGVESNDRGKPPNEKEIKSVCEKVVSKKKKVYFDTEDNVTKIWTFEEGIKRPYFHVKALERTQIKNWRDYLEAEMEREDNHRRVVLLFERCLIACALYEDFWLKYARYLVKTDPEGTRNVFQRACEIHLPKKANIHLHWATFEELQGNYTAAAKILENLEKTLPSLAMVKMRRVALNRRAGHTEEAETLLKSYTTSPAKGEESFYVRKYVWFLVKVSKNIDLAREVLKDAISKHGDQVQYYKDLIGLEFSHGDEETVSIACNLALESQGLSDDTKFLFSQRKLEYLEDYGSDAKTVQKAYDEHQKLYRSHKKRQQSVSEAQPASKKAKTEHDTDENKIQTTASKQTYSAKPTTNGNYASQASVSAQPQPAAQIQATAQAYQHTAATDPTSLYYQNYWNYQQQQQKPDAQQYQYSQWPQYQQQYYQQ